ncbi:restriction endonuclease subunit S [Halomonas kenyensis]|uniref:Restriction endonuclease subunit S n=2 Tax=Billgrantia kenyensis TaxID=321266 RepID=A0A7V9W2X4_9GAMM|nr:restriction endonuclease subunit S [Halomonas kenyensis]MCG6661946.1 hypothetical protein [Halomonas kenyensis]
MQRGSEGMSFPRYPEYKDSGVEWLGEVPVHWVVGPLRWYATIQGGVAKGKSYSDDTPTVDLPYLRVANVQDGHVDLSSVNTVTVALSEVERYRLQPGDVLMNEGGDNDKLGRGTVWEGEIADCLHQNHVFAIRPNQYLLPYWLSMFTRSSAARSYFYLYSKQSTNLASISSSNVMSCPLPLPPTAEQRQILSFLDNETARIDALVEEQQRLIELLKEKRQAVISHAVTKGLDPDVPMKDSGVEWLGEVPAHWELKRLGDIVEFSQGKAHEPFVDADGEYICVNSRFVSTNGSSVKRCTKNLTPANKGDVLMVMSDLPNGRALARTFLVEQSDLYAVNQRVCRIRPVAASPLFLFYLLDRHPSLLFKDDGFNQTHLSGGDFTQLRLYLPPENEQSEIVKHLVSHTYQVDGLLVESHENIALLKERRSALISAAVTGKIDVRGWQPPAGSTATTEATRAEMV